MRKFLLAFLLASAVPQIATATTYESPTFHVASSAAAPAVALTLDACGGAADERIIHALIAHHIKATIFVTARWLHRNPAALAELRANAALFEIENHGARHLAAIDTPGRIMGVATAGSPAGLRAEVSDGATAIRAATGRSPSWFRGGTALYSSSAMKLITALHEHIAGYSLLGDGGALYSATKATKVIAAARNGDVIIAHVNHPEKPAGLGVVAGILKLQAKGYVFLRLDDNQPAAPQV
jgi:peptidoglycan/xylan/chitin deacetylase (PgdA/CDA1 family)